MQRILTTKEATIQTVQVEIKALKIGKKQVTMGLFRQLPRSPLVDEDTIQVRGVPWGHVRYWWEGDGSIAWWPGPKLHVVWQYGEELHRAVVCKQVNPERMAVYRQHIQDAIHHWAIATLATATQFDIQTVAGIDGTNAVIDGRNVALKLDHPTMYRLKQYWKARHADPEEVAAQRTAWVRDHRPDEAAASYLRTLDDERAQQTSAFEDYRKLLDERGILTIPPAQLLQNIRALQAERDAYLAAWEKQWQGLSALPQLFIAV